MTTRSLDADYLLSREWNSDVGSIFAAEGRARVEAFVEIFASLFGASEVMLFNFPRGSPPQVVMHRTEDERRLKQMLEYKGGFYLADPFYLALERTTEPYALNVSDLIDSDAFESTEFYRRHYAETKLVDEFCYTARAEPDSWLLISFARSEALGRYAKGEIFYAKQLEPIVHALLASSWKALADTTPLAPPSREEVQLHADLRRARSNFGRSVLTDREFEVAQHMLRGYTIDVIAKRLGMAEGTTKVHRRNIYRKMDIGSHAELFSLFLEVIGSVPIVGDSDPFASYQQR
jgi:DNA-binding CsgD family transcriptional regulator